MTWLQVAAWMAQLLGTAVLLAVPRLAPLPVTVLRWPFVMATLGAGTWTLAAGVTDLLAPDRPMTVLLACLQILGSWGVVIAGMWIAIVVGYRGHLLTVRSFALAWLPPTVVVIIAAVPALSPLVVAQVTQDGSGPVIGWGPVFWSLTTLALLLAGVVVAAGIVAVVATVSGQRATILLAMAVLVPAAVSLGLYVAVPRARMWSMVPPTLLSLALIAWAILGLRAPSLTQLPITAARVLREVRDGVLVLTPDGTVLDINSAARSLLCTRGTWDARTLVGRAWREVADPSLADLPSTRRSLTVTNADGREVELLVDDADGSDPHGALVVVARDVTELAELRRHLVDLATHDPMTGARNRRYLDDRLPTLVAQAGADFPVSVIMLDIDLFKAVNDACGHAVGDRVIITIAEESAAALPKGGDVVRTGGDEFLLLLPGYDEAAAGRLADRLRHRFAELRFATHATPAQVTVSAGVARLRAGMDPDALLSAADRALYRAKLAGRDLTRSCPVGRTRRLDVDEHRSGGWPMTTRRGQAVRQA